MRTMTEEVRQYLDAVETQLSDLDAEDRSELLADVEEHLSEVAAEHSGALRDRLGDPTDYAAELRSSAGFPPRTVEPAPSGASWRSRVEDFLADDRVRWVRGLMAEVAPGWWIARGYLFVLTTVMIVGSVSRADFPFPRVDENQFFGLVATTAAVCASFLLGRLGRRRRRFAIVSVLASCAVAIMTLWGVADERSSPVFYEEPTPTLAGVRHWDGSEALNLCPYSGAGEPLSGVLLYDQAGRPIIEVPRLPGSPRTEVPNEYPRKIRLPSGDGVVRNAPCPELANVEIDVRGEPSWIEAAVRGTTIFRGLLQPGEARTFYGPQIHLVVGNSGAVEIRANGEDLGRPGAMGEVYRAVFGPNTKMLPPMEVEVEVP